MPNGFSRSRTAIWATHVRRRSHDHSQPHIRRALRTGQGCPCGRALLHIRPRRTQGGPQRGLVRRLQPLDQPRGVRDAMGQRESQARALVFPRPCPGSRLGPHVTDGGLRNLDAHRGTPRSQPSAACDARRGRRGPRRLDHPAESHPLRDPCWKTGRGRFRSHFRPGRRRKSCSYRSSRPSCVPTARDSASPIASSTTVR